jgi:hypothetical protein
MGQTGLPLFTLGHHRMDLKDSGHLTIRRRRTDRRLRSLHRHRMGRRLRTMRWRSLSSHDSSDLWQIGTLAPSNTRGVDICALSAGVLAAIISEFVAKASSLSIRRDYQDS